MGMADLYKAEAVARAEALVEQLKAEGDSFEAVKGILTNFINYFDEYLDGPGIFGDDDILEIAGD